ncbi:MAG TPA: carbohydrate binding domain-containing protein [Marinagarivorans sp.]
MHHQKPFKLLCNIVCGLSLGAATAACSKDVVSAANGVVVQSAHSENSPESDFEASITVEPEKPLRWTFSASDSISAKHGYLMARQVPLRHASDKGHWGLGSLFISNRTESWHGMLLRLPRLEQEKAFKVSLWVKLDNVEFPSNATMVLTRVMSGKINTVELANAEIIPGAWQKLEGTFTTLSEFLDSLATIHIDMSVVSANYHIDDITLSYAEFDAEKSFAASAQKSDIVRNGDVELGLDYWSHQGGAINVSTKHAHSGKQSIFISDRLQNWNAPTMELHDLKSDLQYRVSIFTRLKEGTAPTQVRLTLKSETSGQTAYMPLASAKATDANWIAVSGVFSGASVKNADSVIVYLEASDPTASYYVDTLTVEALLPEQ